MDGVNLVEISKIAFPIVTESWACFCDGGMSDVDFVCFFLLSDMVARYPGKWLGRPRKDGVECLGTTPISAVASFVVACGGSEYLSAHGASLNTPVQHLLCHWSLHRVRDVVSRCVGLWSRGEWRCVLRPDIPSAEEVLHMQARGERVVTCMLRLEDMQKDHVSRLAYFDGDHRVEHAMDVWEFCIHDMRHMSMMMRPDCHLEQRGVFVCMSRLGNVKEFVERALKCKGDDDDDDVNDVERGRLWEQLDYVLGDMNAHARHMLGYVLAKMCSEVRRRCKGDQQKVKRVMEKAWREMISGFGLSEDQKGWNGAWAMLKITLGEGQKDANAEELLELREWLQNQAR